MGDLADQRLLVGGTGGAAIVGPLGERGYSVSAAGSAEAVLAAFRDSGAELVILTLPVDGAGSGALLAELRRVDPRVRVVIAGTDGDVHGAFDALRLGACEYLPTGAEVGELLFLVGLLLGARRGDAHLAYLRALEAGRADLDELVAESPPMRRVLAAIRGLCQRPAASAPRAVLLTGEAGTGKRLLARALHYGGNRRTHPFVELGCAALAASELDSELFGHARAEGAGTRVAGPGMFEVADGGTLLLDEIGATTGPVQARVLTAIEERLVLRAGARAPRAIDVQVLATSRRDLAAMVGFGQFGATLHHRLCVDWIELPPLRDRGEDRVQLARHFISALCRDHGVTPRRLADDAIRLIESHPWPGNLDELRNRLERIVLLVDGEVVRASHFQVTRGRSRTSPERSG